MKGADGPSMMLVLRAYPDGESREVCDRHSGRIAEFIIEKAMRGHFGYFKLVLDLVDGKLHRTANQEMMGVSSNGTENRRKPLRSRAK